MLSFALSKPGVPEAYRTSLAREFPPADAMASVLAAMLAKYEKRDEARTMDDILKEVVNELSAPDRLRAKIAEYRANMPGKATMKDDEIAAELTAGYRRAADLAIARSVYGRIPDPSKVISARVLELRSARLTEIEKQEQAEEKKRLEKGLPPRT